MKGTIFNVQAPNSRLGLFPAPPMSESAGQAVFLSYSPSPSLRRGKR